MLCLLIRGTSYEYQQHMISCREKKNINALVENHALTALVSPLSLNVGG